MQVELHLTVENNSKFVRGKHKSREDIEWDIPSRYQMEKPHKDSHWYILTISYETDEELDRIIYDDILGEAHCIADVRNGFVEADIVAVDDRPEVGRPPCGSRRSYASIDVIPNGLCTGTITSGCRRTCAAGIR